MNVCFFGGRLVKDFEKRECADGSKVLTNSLAIKKSQDKTVFVDIAIFTTKLCEIQGWPVRDYQAWPGRKPHGVCAK